MKTVKEVLEEMKDIDNHFFGKENKEMRTYQKINQFFDVPDKIFYEALRLNNVDLKEFQTINYIRNIERKKNKRLEEYNNAYSNKKSLKTIIAIFNNGIKNELSYICFEIGNKYSIEKYLVSSKGKAISFAPSSDCKYWVIQSDVNDNFLMFRQDDNIGFTDIDNSETDLKYAQYLTTL